MNIPRRSLEYSPGEEPQEPKLEFKILEILKLEFQNLELEISSSLDPDSQECNVTKPWFQGVFSLLRHFSPSFRFEVECIRRCLQLGVLDQLVQSQICSWDLVEAVQYFRGAGLSSGARDSAPGRGTQLLEVRVSDRSDFFGYIICRLHTLKVDVVESS